MRGVIVVVCAWVMVAAVTQHRLRHSADTRVRIIAPAMRLGIAGLNNTALPIWMNAGAGLSFFTRGVLSTLRTRIAVLKRMIMGILLTE
jgi:hypothetical protein